MLDAVLIAGALQHIGSTIPPQADAGWIGEAGPGPSYLDPGSGGPENDFTNRNTTFMTWNLMHLARLLKDAGGVPAQGNQRALWDAGCRFDYHNPEYAEGGGRWPMSTFVLVHGAWHGGWCWDRLHQPLAALGHESITVDLPCEDGAATFDDYASVVLAATPSGTPDLVLVGHSLGAMTIPIAAARRPARALVFLCPVIPNLAGTPWDDGPPMDAGGVYDPLVRHPDGSTSWPDLESACAAFYADCDPRDAQWAYARLRRQNTKGLWAGTYPLTAWPTTRLHVVAGTDDAATTVEWVRHAARRLAVEPLLIPGGHSPFLARPELLAETLDRIAQDSSPRGAGTPGPDRRPAPTGDA